MYKSLALIAAVMTASVEGVKLQAGSSMSKPAPLKNTLTQVKTKSHAMKGNRLAQMKAKLHAKRANRLAQMGKPKVSLAQAKAMHKLMKHATKGTTLAELRKKHNLAQMKNG